MRKDRTNSISSRSRQAEAKEGMGTLDVGRESSITYCDVVADLGWQGGASCIVLGDMDDSPVLNIGVLSNSDFIDIPCIHEYLFCHMIL